MSTEPEALTTAVMFTMLRERGVARVVVDYDGSGDSGGIETVVADDQDGNEVKNVLSSLDARGHAIATWFEEYADNYLTKYEGGWEINDGAYGTFTFDLATSKVEWEHNVRYTDSTLTARSFTL